jgi:hypothetical protein
LPSEEERKMSTNSSNGCKSSEYQTQWMQRVHRKQSQRTPEALEAARSRIEQARQHEALTRHCQALKGHARRSRALVSESLTQMSNARTATEHMEIQGRWRTATIMSSRHADESVTYARSAMERRASCPNEQAVVLRSQNDEEDDAMAEAARTVGASDVTAMISVGMEGLAPPGYSETARGADDIGGGGSSMQSVLNQLRHEPEDEAECTAKFMLYENYAAEVEQMRETLLKFHEETKPTVPPAIASDMNKQVKAIDSTEAMGIYDEAREWFVYHMMRQAERSNLKMAGILDGFEKKLEFLANNNQSECPICLEVFAAEGVHAPETLGCCHKVCKDCWETWTSVTGGRPFCPLCRHDEFLGVVAAHDTEAIPSPSDRENHTRDEPAARSSCGLQ